MPQAKRDLLPSFGIEQHKARMAGAICHLPHTLPGLQTAMAVHMRRRLRTKTGETGAKAEAASSACMCYCQQQCSDSGNRMINVRGQATHRNPAKYAVHQASRQGTAYGCYDRSHTCIVPNTQARNHPVQAVRLPTN